MPTLPSLPTLPSESSDTAADDTAAESVQTQCRVDSIHSFFFFLHSFIIIMYST